MFTMGRNMHTTISYVVQSTTSLVHPVQLGPTGEEYRPNAGDDGFGNTIGRFLDPWPDGTTSGHLKDHLGVDYNRNDGGDDGQPFYSISNGVVKCLRDTTITDTWERISKINAILPDIQST